MASPSDYVFRGSIESDGNSALSQDVTESEGSEFEAKETELSIVVVGSSESEKWKFVKDFLSPNDFLNVGNLSKRIQVGNEHCVVRMIADEGLEDCWGAMDRTIRNADGFIFLYKSNLRETLNLFPSSRDTVFQHKQADRIPFLIVAVNDKDSNEITESNTFVSEEEGRKLAEIYGAMFRSYQRREEIDDIVQDLLKSILETKQAEENIFDFIEAPTIFEIIVAGDVFVGKSSFISQIITGDYPKAYRTTEAKTIHMLKLKMEDSNSCVLKLVDTPGLIFPSSIGKDTLLSTHAFVLFYSITSRASFLEVEKLRTKILNINAKQPTLVVGTKADKSSDRQVSTKEGEAMARKLGCLWGNEISVQTEDLEKVFLPLIKEMRSIYKFDGIEVPELDKQGGVLRLGRGGWKPVLLTLQNFTLSYVKGEKLAKSTMRNVAKKIDLTEAGISLSLASSSQLQSPEVACAFVVSNSKLTLSLCAASEEEREVWMNTIRANIILCDVLNYLLLHEMKGIASEIAPSRRPVRRRSNQLQMRSSEDGTPKTLRKISENLHGSKDENSKRSLRRTASYVSESTSSAFANFKKNVKARSSPLTKRKPVLSLFSSPLPLSRSQSVTEVLEKSNL